MPAVRTAPPGSVIVTILCDGADRYLVLTQWRSKADFEAWQSSREFGKGHAQAAQDRNSDRPASTSGEVWQFEVIQTA